MPRAADATEGLLLRTLSGGREAAEGVGERLFSTLAGSRGKTAGVGGDGIEMMVVEPEPEPESEHTIDHVDGEEVLGRARSYSSPPPRDAAARAELVVVAAAPAEIESTAVLAASEHRPHPAFELAEKIPSESIGLTNKVLGQGRFGVVREGLMSDARGRRVRVAVKMLVGVKPGEAGAFEQEIRVLQHIAGKCNSVCRLYGTCWLQKSLCIVMKQYTMSLDKLMDSSPARKLPLRRAVQLMSQVVVGLAELHELRVIVHDLKPSNILIDEYGQPAIADFGVSTVCETQSVYMPTHAGAMKGTFNYMSAEAFDPEQFGGITSATDIWSVGCSLLELVTGKPPWEGIGQPVIMSHVVIRREHPPIEPGIPAGLEAILRKCFKSTAAERPRARDLALELQELLVNLPAMGQTPFSDVERRKVEWVRQDLGMIGLSGDKPVTEAEMANFARAVTDKLGFSPRSPAGGSMETMRGVLLRAEEAILQETADLGSSDANRFKGGYFLSHNQGKSGPAVMRLRGRMEAACPKLRGKLWYDKDNIPTEDEMRLGIKRCTFFLLFLSAEVLLRPFVRKEIHWAILYKKKIVLVWEQEGENAVGSFGTFFEDCAKEINGETLDDITGDLFGQNVAIPYFTDDEFGAVSLAQILREGGYNSEAEALLVPRPVSMPSWVQANFVFHPNGEGQTMSIKNELEEICPSLWGRLVTQKSLEANQHLIIFVTSGAFADMAVQSAASAALEGGNAVTMIVETDDRHGGATMDSITSVPSKLLMDAPAEVLRLAQECTVVPFYKDRAYRRVSLTKVLQSLAQTGVERDGPYDVSKGLTTPRLAAVIASLMVIAITMLAAAFSNNDVAAQACGYDASVQALTHATHRCDADGTSVPSGTHCSVNCMEGYRADPQVLLQQTKRVCTDGSWSGLLPDCKAEACVSTDIPANSHNECEGQTGDECNLHCDKGYAIAGSSVLTCGLDHVFRGDGTCDDIDECETSNGGCADLEICKNTLGSHSCRTCVRGFTRGPEVNSTRACSPRCSKAGIPHPSSKESNRCSFPFTYAGQTYNDCTMEHLPSDLPPGSSWCATGPNPSDYQQCIECSTVLTCPPLVAPSFGAFACSAAEAFGSSCDLTCDDGYGYHGPIKYECEWSETWMPSNATSACIDRCTDSGALCQFPFRLNGKQYNDCTEDPGPKGTEGSQWCATGDDSRTQHAKCVPCQDVDCGELDSGSYAQKQKHYTAHCNATTYHDYGTCEARCDAGYYGTRSTMVATCGKDYSWHWAHDDHAGVDGARCQRCPAGTFADAGSSTCTKCLPGQYDEDLDPSTPCVVCSPGSETGGFGGGVHDRQLRTGATKCLQCVAGQFSTSSSAGCQVCEAGHQTDTLSMPGGTTCTPCLPGTYSQKIGSTAMACQPCRAGYVTNTLALPGASSCSACSPGMSSNNATIGCENCVAGKYANVEGGSECVECSALPCRACLDSSSGRCACQIGYIPERLGSQTCIPSPCAHDTCSNHGACSVVDGTCPTCLPTASCDCENGYILTHGTCTLSPCQPGTCSHHGTCQVVDGEARCTCQDGYNGANCEHDLCQNLQNCNHHGTCIRGAGSAYCRCSSEYIGANCQTVRTDANGFAPAYEISGCSQPDSNHRVTYCGHFVRDNTRKCDGVVTFRLQGGSGVGMWRTSSNHAGYEGTRWNVGGSDHVNKCGASEQMGDWFLVSGRGPLSGAAPSAPAYATGPSIDSGYTGWTEKDWFPHRHGRVKVVPSANGGSNPSPSPRPPPPPPPPPPIPCCTQLCTFNTILDCWNRLKVDENYCDPDC